MNRDALPAPVGTPIYSASVKDTPLRQGEILTRITQYRFDPRTLQDKAPKLVPIVHPYAIIVSQDCDLDWDFKARQDTQNQSTGKLLPHIMFCMLTTAEILRQGDRDHPALNSAIWNVVKNNKNERYHFFEGVGKDLDAHNEELPELGADFKRYFTLPTEEVYFQIDQGQALRRCCLSSPYLEHLSTRFSYYQFRVALPEDHYSQPAAKP